MQSRNHTSNKVRCAFFKGADAVYYVKNFTPCTENAFYKKDRILVKSVDNDPRALYTPEMRESKVTE